MDKDIYNYILPATCHTFLSEYIFYNLHGKRMENQTLVVALIHNNIQ